MIRLNDETVILVFQLHNFRTIDHKYVKELLTEEILQTIQIIIIIQIKSTTSILVKKLKITRATSTESSSYSSEWAVDKIVFRKTCSHFWMIIENFRNSKKFTVFKTRNIQAKLLNDDFDQLFSSSSSSSLIKMSSVSKKKFHRRSISLQSISLFYKEKKLKLKESSRIIQKSKRTTTTSLNDSSISASLSKIREETVDEEISRMNRIIK